MASIRVPQINTTIYSLTYSITNIRHAHTHTLTHNTRTASYPQFYTTN